MGSFKIYIQSVYSKIRGEYIKSMFPTYFTRPMTHFIKDTYKKSNLTGVEIGVEVGHNSKSILQELPIKKLYLVDPYEFYTQEDSPLKLETIERPDEFYTIAKKRLSKYKNQIEFIKKKSNEAVDEIPDNLDFVYIDGNHDYKYVKKDIQTYYPKLKNGGILGGHDFCADYVGVCKAALEFAEKNKLKLYTKDMDWWVVKK
jgi:hypothetical protein